MHSNIERKKQQTQTKSIHALILFILGFGVTPVDGLNDSFMELKNQNIVHDSSNVRVTAAVSESCFG